MRIKFSSSPAGCDRRHYLTEEDIRVLLSRLPMDLYSRLRAVHFNDRARGRRCLGYVNQGRREIAICALPPRVSLTSCFGRKKPRASSPGRFGAIRGAQWTTLAVRRFLLYDVFLHELGHLQVVSAKAKSNRRRFADETKAQEFANHWREILWAETHEHPDPAHNPPSKEEFSLVGEVLRAPLPPKQKAKLRDLMEFHLHRLGRGIDSEFGEILGVFGDGLTFGSKPSVGSLAASKCRAEAEASLGR